MIRDFEKSDIPACISIVKFNWGEAESIRFAKEIYHTFDITEYSPHYYVFEMNNEVAGFAGMMPSHLMHNIWDFIWVNVDPTYKQTGIGTQLTWFRIHEAQRQGATAIHLMTKDTNFFKKFGFLKVHTYQGSPGNSWMLMVKQLATVHL